MKRPSFVMTVVQLVAATLLLGCGVPEGEGATAAAIGQTVEVNSSAISQSASSAVVPTSEGETSLIQTDPTTERCNGECCRFVCDNGSTWINRDVTCGHCTDEGRLWCQYKRTRLEHAWWGPC